MAGKLAEKRELGGGVTKQENDPLGFRLWRPGCQPAIGGIPAVGEAESPAQKGELRHRGEGPYSPGCRAALGPGTELSRSSPQVQSRVAELPVWAEAVGPETAEDRTCWLGCPKGPSVIGDSDVGMESEGSHLWRNRSRFSQGEGSA